MVRVVRVQRRQRPGRQRPGRRSAFTATHLATCAATLAWVAMEWIVRGKPTTLGAASGAVAGLVAITPAAGFVGPMSAILIGIGAGVICYLAVLVKPRLGYDDSLDVVGVHCVGGIWGALATGLFASKAGELRRRRRAVLSATPANFSSR